MDVADSAVLTEVLEATAAPPSATPLDTASWSPWPAGPWDHPVRGDVPQVLLPVGNPWPAGSGLFCGADPPGVDLELGPDLGLDLDLELGVEDLYPEGLVHTPYVAAPQVVLDSLLPDDAYAQPPPEYPLFNWTLPYGPDADVHGIATTMSLSPSTMHPAVDGVHGVHGVPVTPTASMRGGGRRSASATPIRVQFRGPNEIRRACAEACAPQQGSLIVPCGNDSQEGVGTPPVLSLPSPLHLLDDEVVEVEVRTSSEGGEARDEAGVERVTFNSIEEALASIEAQEAERERGGTASVTASMTTSVTTQPRRRRHDRRGRREPARAAATSYHLQAVPPGCAPGSGSFGADEKQEEVIKAAKSLFSKRTRTLYHWLYPDTSKTKLKATVSAAWDTLADTEKQFYLSQVLGRFGLQASSLMINPQLDGIKGLPVPVPVPSPAWSGPAALASAAGGVDVAFDAARPTRPARSMAASPKLSEAQQAVKQLFASCADSDTWTSFNVSPSTPPPPPPKASPRARTVCGLSERRKRAARVERLGTLASDQLDEEVTILKRMREAKLEAELQDDAELSSELEKFRLLANGTERAPSYKDGDDFWGRTLDPDDIFTELEF